MSSFHKLNCAKDLKNEAGEADQRVNQINKFQKPNNERSKNPRNSNQRQSNKIDQSKALYCNGLNLYLTSHAKKRMKERCITIDTIADVINEAKRFGYYTWHIMNQKMVINYEFKNINVVFLPETKGNNQESILIITVIYQEISMLQRLEPKLNDKQYDVWQRIMHCVWSFTNEHGMKQCIYEELSKLLPILLQDFSSQEINDIFFTFPQSIPSNEHLPWCSIYKIIASRDLQAKDYIETAYHLPIISYNPPITCHFINKENGLFERNILSPLITENIENIRQCLLNHGDPNEQDMNGWNAIFWTTFRGNIEGIQLLISYGANLHITERKGWTPLHTAVMSNKYEVIELLLTWLTFCQMLFQKYKPDLLTINQEIVLLEAQSSNNLNILHICQTMFQVQEEINALKYIIETGNQPIGINKLDWSGRSPLLQSSFDIEIIYLLLKYNASVTVAESFYQNTILHVLAYIPEQKQPQPISLFVMNLLLNVGAPVLTYDCNQETPLQLAIHQKKYTLAFKMILMLLLTSCQSCIDDILQSNYGSLPSCLFQGYLSDSLECNSLDIFQEISAATNNKKTILEYMTLLETLFPSDNKIKQQPMEVLIGLSNDKKTIDFLCPIEYLSKVHMGTVYREKNQWYLLGPSSSSLEERIMIDSKLIPPSYESNQKIIYVKDREEMLLMVKYLN